MESTGYQPHELTKSRRSFNTLRQRQNGRHFPDDNFKRIFLNENVRLSIKKITDYSSLGTDWSWIIIGSDNALAPTRRQAIIWINDG